MNGFDTRICDEAAASFIKSSAIKNFREYTKKLQPVQLTLSDVDLFVEEQEEKTSVNENPEADSVAAEESPENEEISENTEILNADNADDSFVVDDDTVGEIIVNEISSRRTRPDDRYGD